MPEPEHFAAIAARHFVRLREIPMLDPTSPIGANFNDPDHDDPSDRPAGRAPTYDVAAGECHPDAARALHNLPSATDHYRDACDQLALADSNGYNLAEAARLHESARLHLQAGQLALDLWPGKSDDPLLEENQAMAAELARLLPVAQAARAWFASIDVTGSDADAELAEAVRALEAGE